MAPSKWDEEEEGSPPAAFAPPRRKFDDEEEDEVLDSWDAAEDSDAEREKEAAAAAAKAKADEEAAAHKKSKAQRIEEHKQERRKAAEEAQEEAANELSEDETERKARLRRTEKESDLKHAEDLFGELDLNTGPNKSRGEPKAVVVGTEADPTQAVDLSAMPLFKPTTKDQFATLSTTLAPLLTANSKKPQYSIWVQDFVKQLVRDLPSDQVKKASSALSTMSNEKLKEERAADKGTKKSKASKTKVTLNTSRDNQLDTGGYDDDGLGDDDFM